MAHKIAGTHIEAHRSSSAEDLTRMFETAVCETHQADPRCPEEAAVSHPHRAARKDFRDFPNWRGEARTVGRGSSSSSAMESLIESRSWEADQGSMLRVVGPPPRTSFFATSAKATFSASGSPWGLVRRHVSSQNCRACCRAVNQATGRPWIRRIKTATTAKTSRI